MRAPLVGTDHTVNSEVSITKHSSTRDGRVCARFLNRICRLSLSCGFHISVPKRETTFEFTRTRKRLVCLGPSELTPRKTYGRTRSRTETLEVPHLRQGDGRILRRTIPCRRDRSGHAPVDWSVG